MKIECCRFKDITHDKMEEIKELLTVSFPDLHGVFYEKNIPNYIVVALENDHVIGQVAVYERLVSIDDVNETIGILSLVAISGEYQHKGISKKILQAAHEVLKMDGMAFSLLFAINEDYYKSSGYISMKNKTTFIEDSLTKTFIFRGGMVKTLSDTHWDAEWLDLLGEVV